MSSSAGFENAMNIWKQMSYTAPRGPCAYKTSLVSPACACLRFMIHPVKAATSFECDGCNHHASFHKMENKTDDEIVSRWRAAEADINSENSLVEVTQPTSRRKRLALEDSIWREDDVFEPKAKRTSARPKKVAPPPPIVGKRKIGLPKKGYIEGEFISDEDV